MSKPKILLLDVETVPGKAYIWSPWDKFIPLERLIESGRVVCVSWKWYGKAGVEFRSEWYDGTEAMLNHLSEAMNEADAIITYNGDKFDFVKLAGEFIVNDIEPPAPVTSIDLYKFVKKLGFQSNKLEFVAKYLKIGEKVKHEGFSLWKAVMGDGVTFGEQMLAQDKMEKYNKQDVKLLEGLYKRLRPYMQKHPRIRDKGDVCPNCGSKHLHNRGYTYTRLYKKERRQCQDCGAWNYGKQEKIK